MEEGGILMLTIQSLPEKMSEIPLDWAHLNRALINGCFRETVQVGDQARSFLSYLPDEIEYCQRCIVVCPPAAADPLEFLESSGLKAMADQQKLYVFLMETNQPSWNQDETAVDFMNAVYVKIQARDYYVTMQDNIYALGVGDGAEVAQRAASRMSGDWSGLMTIGDLNVDLAKDSATEMEAQNQNGVELQVSGQKSQLPVWMAFGSLEQGENGAAVEYWKAQNQVVGEPLSGQGADVIWMPTPVRMTDETNEEKVAQVRVTVGKTVSDTDMIPVMWKYIGSLRRHRGQGGKILRYFKDPADYGATLHTMVVDGITRIWYEFVPDCCTKDKQWPLVVTMHGRGGTAETFFDLSGMANIAKERKFIVVFPQSSIYQQKPNGLKNVHRWNGVYEGKDIDDIKFIRSMVEDVKKRQPVDPGRVYACGQSSGGLMADTLCNHAGDLFAACATWSSTEHAASQDLNIPETEDLVPTLLIFGDRDFLCASKDQEPDEVFPFRPSKGVRRDLLHKIEKYGCDCQDVETWETYPITWWCYRNKEHVPMLTVGRVFNMVHANYPEESRISFDQFFSQFWKDSDGTLYYRGKAVLKK